MNVIPMFCVVTYRQGARSGVVVRERCVGTLRCWNDETQLLSQHSYVDQSPLVARRLGFASLPLAVLAILIGSQSIGLLIAMHTDDSLPWTWSFQELSNDDLVNIAKWVALGVLFWLWYVMIALCMRSSRLRSCCSLSTVVIKIIVGVRLLSYATKRRAGMEARAAADVINDFGRDPIGEGKEERVSTHFLYDLLCLETVSHANPRHPQKYNRDLKTLLDNRRDDAAPVAETGERKSGDTGLDANGKKKRLALEEITRFTMVKRIW